MTTNVKANTEETVLTGTERDTLRRLAAKRMEVAGSALNLQRSADWYRHDAGPGGRAMILAEFGGVTDENRPVGDRDLVCADHWGRMLEKRLRSDLYEFEVLQHDRPLAPFFDINWKVDTGNYGVEIPMHWAGNDGRLAGRHWDPPIKDLDSDFPKLKPRTFKVDRDATLEQKARIEGVFGDILPVRIRGMMHWTMGLTWRAIELIGLENLMMFMFDNPAGLHRLMAFLRDDHLAFAAWLEREGLYTFNNEADSIGSGSCGCTRRLPRKDWKPGDPVRTCDQWVLLESQETVGVGPDQFEEFVFPYQRAIGDRFGLVYYGCCEPLDGRWHVIERLPNLDRVSVSPWANEERMAGFCGGRIAYSRKPSPALISTSAFDEVAIRADLRRTLEVARGCRLEIIMKDVHTLNNEPGRLARWVRMAREEAAKAGR